MSTEKIFPLAQTFFISGEAYPFGIFATSVDLFIKSKPTEEIPLQIELALTQNGQPSSLNILPFSRRYVSPTNINIPADPGSINSILAAATNVKFSAPVYMEPGKEYALVLLSTSPEYETYVAVMGQTILGTDTVVRSQISLGTLYKTQNASVWTPFQNEDLMFGLNKAVYPINQEGTLVLRNKIPSKKIKVNQFNHNLEPLMFSGATTLASSYQVKRASNGILTSKTPYYLKTDEKLIEEGYVEGPEDFLSEIKMMTFHKDVSPFLDMTKNSVITVHNLINNLGLQRNGISIVDAGSGYDIMDTTISVTSASGSGAVIEPVIVGGQITDVIVTNPGSGYVETPTISVSSGSGSGAVIEYTGGFEISPSDGNADSRYITRNITLKEGFEATFVTVQFDLNQVDGTAVEVYYRAKASEDVEDISAKNWIKMKKTTDSVLISPDETTFTEVSFEPSTFTLEYESNGTTYTSASVIAIKVVFLSNNSVKVPKIRNFRAITSV